MKIAAFPFQQRAVISLRHIANWTAEDVFGAAVSCTWYNAEKVVPEMRFALLQGLGCFDGQLYRGSVCFLLRLGQEFDPSAAGIHDYRLLAPFKTKPLLRDWFEIPPMHLPCWEELARVALQRMRATQE